MHRIHGPPGCGKTSQLAAWAKRACERFGPNKVALCSMTRTAAHEIRSRGLPVPHEQVGTLHALCHRALGRPKLYVEHIDDWNARHPNLRLSGGGGDEEEQADGPRNASLGDELDGKLGLLRARQTPLALWPRDVKNFADAWENWKADLGILDFTDLIERALLGGVPPPGSCDVLFVDEAQDLSALEHALVRHWAESTAFTVISGDSDQALYPWRGGDPEAFLKPLPAGPGAEHPLTQSYRVPETVRVHAAAWIAQCRERFPVEYRARRGPDGQVVAGALVRSSATLKQQEAIVELVQAELDAVDGSVMVLASCAYMLQPTIAALRAAGIPFHCPYRVKQGAWNPMRGACARLASFVAPYQVPGWEEPRMWTAPELWSVLEQTTAAKTMHRGMKVALESVAKSESKGATHAPLTLTALKSYMLEAPLTELLASLQGHGPTRLVAWLRKYLAPAHQSKWDFAVSILTHRGFSALTDEPRLVLGTCHAVKGGEAKSVILSPDASPAAMRQWTAGGRPKDEVRRTFYVGMTRTSERLTILGSAGGYPGALPI